MKAYRKRKEKIFWKFMSADFPDDPSHVHPVLSSKKVISPLQQNPLSDSTQCQLGR